MAETLPGGVGFLILNSNFQIIVAGCNKIEVHTLLEAELEAIRVGFYFAIENHLHIDFVFTNSIAAWQAINQEFCDKFGGSNTRSLRFYISSLRYMCNH